MEMSLFLMFFFKPYFSNYLVLCLYNEIFNFNVFFLLFWLVIIWCFGCTRNISYYNSKEINLNKFHIKENIEKIIICFLI